MSKDPAFLFYPADAAEDVSHMNRLERGCYFDIVQAQKKFGKLSLELIKKILGKDFETCWENIKICLSYDNDMYFISWLQNSIEKRIAYSESRKNNRLNKQNIENQLNKDNHMNNISERYDNHMGNGIVNINSSIKKGVKGENIKGVKFDEKLEFVFFSDGSSQMIGSEQKYMIENKRLSPIGIIKGSIY